MLLLMSPATHCSRCRRAFSMFIKYRYANGVPMTTGYGVTTDGVKLCYGCCGDDDRAAMKQETRMTLYLTREKVAEARGNFGPSYVYYVSNWPGTLRIRIGGAIKESWHNIAGKRYDVWFSFEGDEWHGVQYGDNTQILHCRKLKPKKKAQRPLLYRDNETRNSAIA